MTYKMHRAFVASLSAVALILAATETFAGSGVAHIGGSASTPSTFHPTIARSLRHHRGNNAAVFWPGTEDAFYGPSNGEPMGDATQPTSGDIRHTYTYDVPWDWAHRYPPAVTPSQPVVRAYVPGCPAQTVTVPGADGRDQTINIVRCY